MHCSAYLIRFLKKSKRTVFTNRLLTCSALWTKPLQSFIAHLSKFSPGFLWAERSLKQWNSFVLHLQSERSAFAATRAHRCRRAVLSRYQLQQRYLKHLLATFPTQQSWEQAHQAAHRHLLSCPAGQREPGCLLPQPPEPRTGCHDDKPSSATRPSLQLWLQLWKKQNKTSQYPQSPKKPKPEPQPLRSRAFAMSAGSRTLMDPSLGKVMCWLLSLFCPKQQLCLCEYKPWPESSNGEAVTTPGSQTCQTF